MDDYINMQQKEFLDFNKSAQSYARGKWEQSINGITENHQKYEKMPKITKNDITYNKNHIVAVCQSISPHWICSVAIF